MGLGVSEAHSPELSTSEAFLTEEDLTPVLKGTAEGAAIGARALLLAEAVAVWALQAIVRILEGADEGLHVWAGDVGDWTDGWLVPRRALVTGLLSVRVLEWAMVVAEAEVGQLWTGRMKLGTSRSHAHRKLRANHVVVPAAED